eukprot:s1393_g5.t1
MKLGLLWREGTRDARSDGVWFQLNRGSSVPKSVDVEELQRAPELQIKTFCSVFPLLCHCPVVVPRVSCGMRSRDSPGFWRWQGSSSFADGQGSPSPLGGEVGSLA